MKKTLLLLLTPVILWGQTDSKEGGNFNVGLNSKVTYDLMEPNQNLRKIEILLDAKSDNKIPERGVNFGFSLIGIADYQQSNIDSKFGYLMRHPTATNQIGKTASEVVLHSAQISIIASANSWITAYGELLYNPEQNFGAGTITSIARNQVQFRKGFILLGNKNKTPFYGALGKMDIPFGQNKSVSPFTNSTMWHAFGALAYSAVVGYKKDGLSIAVAAIQGGAQFRAANVPVDETAIPSRVNNFSADANYTYHIEDKHSFKLGASYIKGSAYCQGWPVVHFTPCKEHNPAYTVYGEVNLFKRLLLQGAFAKTVDEWEGTFNPAPPLNVFEASKVSSLSLGGKYQINKGEGIIYSASAEFSNFIAGPNNAPWERQSQLVFGLNAQVRKTTRIFVEVFNTQGYVPLNFISGGNFEDPGVTHSERDAKSIGVVAGMLISL